MGQPAVSVQDGEARETLSKGRFNKVDQARAWELARRQRAGFFKTWIGRMARKGKTVRPRRPASIDHLYGSSRPLGV